MEARAIKTPQGIFYASPTKDSKVYRSLTKGRLYDEDFIQSLSRYVTPLSTVVDIGANLGEMTVAFSPLVQKVYAFEPVARSRRLLERNTRGLQNIEIMPFALGHKKGSVTLTPDNNTNSGTYRVTGTGTVPLRTLDSFHFSPDFIKIDVQGMEVRVLQGAMSTIHQNRPVVLFELSELTVGFGEIYKLLWLFPKYKFHLVGTNRQARLHSMIVELYIRYFLKRPKQYDILALP